MKLLDIFRRKKLKVFLDDERDTPKGWHRCFTAEQVIDLLERKRVAEVSLDHDLGENHADGYQVLKWIEFQVHTNDRFVPPKMRVHSANAPDRGRMNSTIRHIMKRYAKNLQNRS